MNSDWILEEEFLYNYNDDNQCIMETHRMYGIQNRLIEETTTYTYNMDGLLLYSSSKDKLTSYQYDTSSQLARVWHQYDGYSLMTNYKYIDSKLIEKQTIVFKIEIDSSADYQREIYEYDNDGRLKTHTMYLVGNNKIGSEYEYDDQSNLICERKFCNDSIENFMFHYDHGRLIQKYYKQKNYTHRNYFIYDKRGLLVKEEIGYTNTVNKFEPTHNILYEYDSNNNRTSKIILKYTPNNRKLK